jgi:hypothetical protein
MDKIVDVAWFESQERGSFLNVKRPLQCFGHYVSP